MNRYIKIAPLIFILILASGTGWAQTANNEREIRIAEGILAELFDAKDTGFSFRGGNIRGVSGEYIPEYGVHFKIGTNVHPETVRVILRGHAQIEQAEDPDTTENAEINKSFVEDRFMEYFKSYASLLRDVPDQEVIRLTFGARSSGRTIVTYPSGADRQRNTIPEMTAWALVSDIKSYSSGNLSEREFEDRIQVRDLSDQESERDQEVFSSILEAALNQAGAEHIRIRRNPQVEYLPGLGLNYQVQVSFGSRPFFGDFDLDIDLEGVEFMLDSLNIGLTKLAENMGERIMPITVKLDSIFNPSRINGSSDSLIRVYRDSLDRSAPTSRNVAKEDSLSDEEIQEEINKLHAELIQTVTEYGQTLRSLQNNEILMITLNWSGRHPALPQRSVLRIRKSDLLNGSEPEIFRIERN